MIGTILFSSKIRYGKNKRNIPFYLFVPENTEDGKVYMIASKQGAKTKVDHYAKIEIIDSNSKPIRGAVQEIFGPVNDIEASIKFTLYKYSILPRKPVNVMETNFSHDRLDLTEEESIALKNSADSVQELIEIMEKNLS